MKKIILLGVFLLSFSWGVTNEEGVTKKLHSTSPLNSMSYTFYNGRIVPNYKLYNLYTFYMVVDLLACTAFSASFCGGAYLFANGYMARYTPFAVIGPPFMIFGGIIMLASGNMVRFSIKNLRHHINQRKNYKNYSLTLSISPFGYVSIYSKF